MLWVTRSNIVQAFGQINFSGEPRYDNFAKLANSALQAALIKAKNLIYMEFLTGKLQVCLKLALRFEQRGTICYCLVWKLLWR